MILAIKNTIIIIILINFSIKNEKYEIFNFTILHNQDV
jgi:hypothetical protein